jgi:microcin C transport system permease protein
MRLNPLTVKKIRRFQSIRRGYYSLIIITVLLILAAFAELLVNNRALVVRYDGKFYFPTYGAMIPGTEFGYDYSYETNYRSLKDDLKDQPGNWVIMPIIPYNPYENTAPGEFVRPRPPDFGKQHYLGTDVQNRDILSRLVYGFRNVMIFAFGFVIGVYILGILIGCAMGYLGGWFDLIVQRLVEIWSNIPFLYTIILVSSIFEPSLLLLMAIMITFSWTSMTYYMRTGTYKEKARDYVAAAQVLGASTSRIVFFHILPNIISTLVTFLPFLMASAITALTALDFLGYGLPEPTPSWGEMLRQGTERLKIAPWITLSAFTATTLVLCLITFIGEAIREAFDPKKFTVYR